MVCLLMLNVHAMLGNTENQTKASLSLTMPTQTTFTPQDSIDFPYFVPGTTLVVERTVVYDGPFLEDGSNAEVFHITGIVLRNVGPTGIVQARIVMEQAGRRLEFEAETLSPGQAVLVIEKNKSEYIQKIYKSCYGEQVISDTIWWAKNAPKIEPVGMSTLAVTNTGKTCLENVWLYYKTYQSNPGIYIGGITYKVGIRKLEPGQILQINPPFFVNGYSRIARVTTG